MAFTNASNGTPAGWLNAADGTANQAKFIPEVFSKLLQAKFYSSSVLPAISNTDYEVRS